MIIQKFAYLQKCPKLDQVESELKELKHTVISNMKRNIARPVTVT